MSPVALPLKVVASKLPFDSVFELSQKLTFCCVACRNFKNVEQCARYELNMFVLYDFSPHVHCAGA